MVETLAADPTDRVLDVATGTGLVAQELARRYGCSVVALDQSPQMLAGARQRLALDPSLAARIELVQGEAEHLRFDDAEFDHLTFTYLLRYVDDPEATLAELARVVPAGRADRGAGVRRARSAVRRAAWRLYARIGLPALGRPFGRDWYHVGRFLGPSIQEHYERWPLERLLELLGSRPGSPACGSGG